MADQIPGRTDDGRSRQTEHSTYKVVAPKDLDNADEKVPPGQQVEQEPGTAKPSKKK